MARLDRRYQLGVAAGFGAAAILGLLVFSSRLGVHYPSMLDDWSFAARPVNSIRDLIHPFIYPVGPRFRPGFEIWNMLGWQTLGAPSDVTGPNLWGAVRVLLFVAGAVLVPAVIAATSKPRPSPLGIAALAAAAGILVFSGPWSSADFSRLGPQEPVMVGAAGCGAALIFYACGRAIGWRREPRSRGQNLGLAATFAAGFLLWALGIYQKEASITVLVLAPFLYLFLDQRWRERGLIEGPLWRSRRFQLTVAAMLLPVAHITVVSATISGEGVAIYGSGRPHGLGEWLERGWDAISQQWSGMPSSVGTEAWQIVAVVVPLLLAFDIVRRRRVPWLPLGMLATGVALLVVQGLPLLVQSRYYIPSIALFAGAALLLLAQAPRWLRWVGVAAALVLAVANYDDVRETADYWSERDKDQEEMLRQVAELHPASCPVYLSNVDDERGESLPIVLPLIGEPLSGPCRAGVGTVMVGVNVPEYMLHPLGTTKAINNACAHRVTLATFGSNWEIIDCRRLLPEVKGEPIVQILNQNRLVPGEGLGERRKACAETHSLTYCGLKE
jgi:hypothetical protein